MTAQIQNSKPRIGFVGLGTMGSRMATRLLDAGYPLTIYNRSKDKMAPLAERGATVAATLRELAAGCSIVMTMLSDDNAVEAVLLGPEGALSGARPGTLFIDLSTVYPGTSRKVFEAARRAGSSMIDAPVSGSTAAAEQGDLVIMVGGEKEAYERARPILAVLGSEINYMGASGAGTTMKLVLNAFLGTGLQALAEAIALGEKAGLQKDQLLDVIGQTGVISPAYRGKLENARHDEYPVTFALRLMFKDFGLIMRQAAELSVPMPATAVAQQMCAAENAKGIEEDYSATIRLMEEIAASAPQLMASPSR